MATETEWRGQRDTTRSRFLRVIALSALLHVPLTPIVALLGLMGWLTAPPFDEPPPADPITAIPVDLVSDERPGPMPSPTSEAPPPEPAAKPIEDDPFKELEDSDDPPPAPEPKPKPRPDAGAPGFDAGPADAGPNIGDPVAMAGVAGKVVDANANVRLMVFTDRIRNHPLGNRIGTLLGAVDQWKDFFGPTGLDPIKDVDRILIAGPRLRKSSEVVAVLRVNVAHDKLRAAVDALVKRDGHWLDAGVPAARMQADQAERVIVLPAPQIVVVAPPSAEKHALSLGAGLKFPNPKGNEAMTTFVVTPWRAFIGIPFEIPKSIKWVRMKITATSDGGAVAEVVAEDESPESASKHAEELALSIDKVTHPKVFGFQVVALLEPVKFNAVGSEIHGTVVATPKQLARLLEAVAAYAKQLAEEAEKKAAAKAARADGGAPDGGRSDAGASGTEAGANVGDAGASANDGRSSNGDGG